MYVANLPDGGILTLTMPDGTTAHIRVQRHRAGQQALRVVVDAPLVVHIRHDEGAETLERFREAERRAATK